MENRSFSLWLYLGLILFVFTDCVVIGAETLEEKMKIDPDISQVNTFALQDSGQGCCILITLRLVYICIGGLVRSLNLFFESRTRQVLRRRARSR